MSATTTTTGVEGWLAPLLERVSPPVIVDAHTHLGADCDGTICEPAFLTARLQSIGARAVTFPLALEDGDYRRDNDAVIETALGSGGRLVPFCRLNPHADPAAEGRRAVAAGARGIKLHPRAERFTLRHPAMEDVFALAHEHGLPILIHAGRGIEPLGADALRLAAAFPRATVILAHAAITDLAWIGDALDAHPNILFDTAWWSPLDLVALFALVPAGRIVFGSDTPIGDPALNALLTLRTALEVGLEPEQLRSVLGGQLERLLAGVPLADLGPAPGAGLLRREPLLERVHTYLSAAWGSTMVGGMPAESLALARMALAVDDASPHAEICAAALAALDMPVTPDAGALLSLAPIALAATFVTTPRVPV